MTPADLGLPAKFQSWRPGQDDAIIDTAVSLSNGTRFYVSSQPTGAGKSIYYMALHKLIQSRRTLIVTGTKALQQQLMGDFKEMGLVEIKGQANYPCLAVHPGGEHFGVSPSGSGCDEGPCHAGLECSLKATQCEYFGLAVGRAKKAEIVVTNYDYLMSVNKHSEDFPIGQFDLLVLDEAHDAPDKLSEFVSIYLSARELEDLLGERLPPLEAGIEYWTDWAKEKHAQAKLELEILKQSKGGTVRHVKRLRDLCSKLEDLSLAPVWKRGNPSDPNVRVAGTSTDWVAEEYGHGALFSPIWAHGYAEQYLFSGVPRVVLTSATIIPKTVEYLGLHPEQFVFNERPSTFPPARRPIYIVNGVRVSRNMTRGEMMMWINKIDMILSTRLDRKTIIHAVSYERAKFIYENSRYKRYMVIHGRDDLERQIARFRRMPAPAILVSPSVKQGYDFPYDQCECQIIAKVPFIDIRPAVIRARQRSDPQYIDYLAIMSMIQSCGRGMRAADDFCETFIVDDNVTRLLSLQAKVKIPKWFRTALRRVDTIPAPSRFRKSSANRQR